MENYINKILSQDYIKNYFEKNNEREALGELFQITENDIQKYEPKKRKKRSKNKS